MVTFLTDAPRRLYEYWSSLPKNGLLPPRSAVDPAALKGILPQIAITEWNAPSELKYRLAGTGVVARFGFDPTGRNFLDLVDPDEKPKIMDRLELIVNTPCGARSVRLETYQRGFQQLVEHAVFPLDGNGKSLLITATGSLAQPNELIEPGPLSRIEQPRSNEFIDIGAGVPDLQVPE
jgi:hypothetical protein